MENVFKCPNNKMGMGMGMGTSIFDSMTAYFSYWYAAAGGAKIRAQTLQKNNCRL